MVGTLTENILRFFGLVLFQVLILNHVELGGYLNPFLYILFILMLPFETPEWAVLLLGFFIGLTVDMFTDTLGMHTCATVFMAFMRKYVLRLIAPRDGYESAFKPTFRQMGFSWFLAYTVILVFIHHLLLFYIEVFRLSDFFYTFVKVIASAVFTLLLVFITQFLFHTPRER
jgi:rod shape-determining protein MreD